MDIPVFRKHAHEVVEWICNYYEQLENLPVKSQVSPGDIRDQLPGSPPAHGESFEAIWKDFQDIVLPGMTHWQHPHFHAYFPANTSLPSILGEMITAALAAQCMIWDTSPAAAELEERVMEWMRDAYGLPASWQGVIQDTASTATLVSILTAREKQSTWQSNKQGLQGLPVYRVYASTDVHSSIDKAVQIAGIGLENLVKIPVDMNRSMQPEALEEAIRKDQAAGMIPLCVIIALGSTSTLAVDPLEPIASICETHRLWLHIDAAYAGNALLLPEYRWMIRGIERADTFVTNPHKWLFTNFDLSAYFVKDRDALVRTFSILPEYLKTATTGKVNDYRDWGIALGRRFRALKLWFVLRTYGIEGLQQTLRNHIEWANWFADQVKGNPHLELVTPLFLNMVCLRAVQPGWSLEEANSFNQQWLTRINGSGKAYLTHTKVDGKY
ncbi:MAG: aspartate aminotransferase family protein, partial [Saprospiraceae bacterium]|nr:aspartate aminotransferase family protein [Saprospiraceae bacterium]